MSISVGDIFYDVCMEVHLLMKEYSWIDDGESTHDIWKFTILEKNVDSWGYAVYLEDENDYVRLA